MTQAQLTWLTHFPVFSSKEKATHRLPVRESCQKGGPAHPPDQNLGRTVPPQRVRSSTWFIKRFKISVSTAQLYQLMGN